MAMVEWDWPRGNVMSLEVKLKQTLVQLRKSKPETIYYYNYIMLRLMWLDIL